MPADREPGPASKRPAQAAGTKRKLNTPNSSISQPSSQQQATSFNITQRQTHAQARKRQRTQDARFIASQTTSQAYHGPSQPRDAQSSSAPPADAGQVNVDKFVRAREFEIHALESSLRKAGGGLNSRAFQGVPRELRRRTASHNVRRVPKRLQARARREMIEDNTPAPASRRTARRRERKAKAWLRAGTADVARRIFGSQKKKNVKDAMGKETLEPQESDANEQRKQRPIIHRKFRRRQINKTWLPTHIYHAKRAHMTPPGEPLWRMAIPLSPTAKSYRPTHRAAGERGAIAWDASYMSTIGLSGPESGIMMVLEALGVAVTPKRHKRKWQAGTRTWTGWLHQDMDHITPATILWQEQAVMVRFHPSAFLQLWNILLRVSKSQEQGVVLQDLRFDIGSIELTGPTATEAFVGAIDSGLDDSVAAGVLKRMAEVTDASTLPQGAIISTQIQDPRLYFPPRRKRQMGQRDGLIRLLAEWPLDQEQTPIMLFDRTARHEAERRLPTQKAINRRKALAPPGEYPKAAETDPKIPIVVFASKRASGGTGLWTVLLPWKCVLPVWYCLMHQPLSTGGNPRLGGLDQKRQLAFETGAPWFPGDYPGIEAGASWDSGESEKRQKAWQKRPKGKRDEFESLALGRGRKGELGPGWANAWDLLFDRDSQIPLRQVFVADASQIAATAPKDCKGALVAVRLTLLTRGVPCTCARVYRLPQADKQLRGNWLSLLTSSKERHVHQLIQKLPTDAPVHERRRVLASALLDGPSMPRTGSDDYPDVPDVSDLIGFVTTGNFNLGEGKGTAIANLALERIIGKTELGDGSDVDKHMNICIVRNAGQRTGRLAKWQFADCC